VQQRHRAIRARLTQDTIHATEDGTEDAARVRAAGLQIANKARCCEARRAENRLDCGQAGSGKLRLKGQSKDSAQFFGSHLWEPFALSNGDLLQQERLGRQSSRCLVP